VSSFALHGVVRSQPSNLKETTMSRISIPAVDQSPAKSRPLLDAVQKQLGIVPNLMKLVGNSPAALEGYLSLNGALAKGKLDAKLRERIALAIAEFNGCGYCLSAHTYLATNLAKLDAAEIDAARSGRSGDATADAAVRFARRVAAEHGHVADADLAALRAAGFDDAAIVEIVLNVALNVLTNYVNNIALTDIDFPKVDVRLAA
jgi:uncharacterized peroxidase-related enzyme